MSKTTISIVVALLLIMIVEAWFIVNSPDEQTKNAAISFLVITIISLLGFGFFKFKGDFNLFD